MFHNIEKSAFRKGEYVGYATGQVWHIKRSGKGWQARPNRNGSPTIVFAVTLAQMSQKLNELTKQETPNNGFAL